MLHDDRLQIMFRTWNCVAPRFMIVERIVIGKAYPSRVKGTALVLASCSPMTS